MYISKTPLRLSFVGGGSDLPSFYKRRTGAVISSSIDLFVYVLVKKRWDKNIRLIYSKTELAEHYSKIEHKIVRNVLKSMAVGSSLEICSLADIPSYGSGLGSSSSFTVGLINALSKFYNTTLSTGDLAKDASNIEINMCKEPIGKQDHYAAAFGGLNFIEFFADETVKVTPLKLDHTCNAKLKENILVFNTGIVREASKVLKKQFENLKHDYNFDIQSKMVEIAYDLKQSLSKNKVDDFGDLLNENWLLKKKLNDKVSNDFIEENYDLAIKSGAIGGKLLGAGGGGYLLFYAPRKTHSQIISKLKLLTPTKVNFSSHGSQVTPIK